MKKKTLLNEHLYEKFLIEFFNAFFPSLFQFARVYKDKKIVSFFFLFPMEYVTAIKCWYFEFRSMFFDYLKFLLKASVPSRIQMRGKIIIRYLRVRLLHLPRCGQQMHFCRWTITAIYSRKYPFRTRNCELIESRSEVY